jgi:cytochrome c
MDSFEFNKIAGAVLGTGLLVLGLKNFGGELFHTEAPEKPGMIIEVADATKPVDSGAPVAAVPIAVLLAKADAVKGADAAKACGACHDFTKGGPNKVGPNLWDVVERSMGSAPGFAYSDGIKAMTDKKWTYEELNTWLTSPKAMVAGTKMSYAGMKKDQTRADIIAYLATLSDSPKPFPKP